MAANGSARVVENESTLRDIMGPKMDIAIHKSRPKLDAHCKEFISRSPFLCIGTASSQGKADVSPRGDPVGFVQIVDDNHLFIPDRPGNNRLDTMTNITENPNVGLLFMIPGFNDTLRINGKARIVQDDGLADKAKIRGKAPKVGIMIEVQEAFLHCAKAFTRSSLWDPAKYQKREEMPSLAHMILDQVAPPGKPPTVQEIKDADEFVEDNYKTGLY
ncbi:MAG: pyridoxamine 5'-phosphate oxidase family protein [Alphaproteobacteria bacterium]|nr:pyridoxamine 5'-phosphate oxidase family protein [Alphaproteobacteria bacterium]